MCVSLCMFAWARMCGVHACSERTNVCLCAVLEKEASYQAMLSWLTQYATGGTSHIKSRLGVGAVQDAAGQGAEAHPQRVRGAAQGAGEGAPGGRGGQGPGGVPCLRTSLRMSLPPPAGLPCHAWASVGQGRGSGAWRPGLCLASGCCPSSLVHILRLLLYSADFHRHTVIVSFRLLGPHWHRGGIPHLYHATSLPCCAMPPRLPGCSGGPIPPAAEQAAGHHDCPHGAPEPEGRADPEAARGIGSL